MSNIIYNIIEQVNYDKWYNVSENMEILKGKNKINKIKDLKIVLKRKLFFKKTKI